MKTLQKTRVADKNVLVRVDYNVPIEKGEILSDFRIRESLETIRYLLAEKANKIVLISHLGRPKIPEGTPRFSTIQAINEDLSLKPIALKLAELLPGIPVDFVDAITGLEVEAAVEDLPKGGILLLENLRFDPREEQNSAEFAAEITSSTAADLFVQDGFAVLHRAHTSTVAIPQILPSVAGFLVEKELNGLEKVLKTPKKPFVVMLGGAKVADKRPLVAKFGPKADAVLIGGKIAVEESKDPSKGLEMADKGNLEGQKFYVAEDFDEDSEGNQLDIGPVSTAKFIETLEAAQTVLWNGVLGKVEDPTYATSSTIVAKFLGEHPNITSVICGGDTAGFVENLTEEVAADSDATPLKYTLLSTGGGAALAFLLGDILPGLEVLPKNANI